MRILKVIGITLLIVIVLLVGVAFLLPRNITVERSIVVKADPALVFEQINHLPNWVHWSPWYKLDTLVKMTYSDPPSGTGSWYEWSSEVKNVGKGKLSITKSIPNDTILTELLFMEQGAAMGGFTFTGQDSGTLVKWFIQSDLGNNPIARYFGLFMDKMLGKDFEQGLEALKTYVENHPAFTVNEADFSETSYLYIRDTMSMATIGQKMGQYYGEIMGYLQSLKLEPAGAPLAVYHSWENNVFDVECGIPVQGVKDPGKFKTGMLKAQKVATVDFYGPYEKTEAAHIAIEAWIKANNRTVTGSPWESYVTDPATEKDPNKWLTRIYWPIE